mmetsp:Transcript_90107/g.209637  ORF Transcript_90107/g.209637 Transcript_90107/m.209637 type:complete len:232 (+) Transcript_90107:904-1599(+)
MKLHNCSVQLLGVEHGCSAAFEVGDIAALVCDQQSSLELARLLVVDAEVRRDLHRAPGAFRYVAERAITEDCAVQGREEVVGGGHDAPEIPLDEIRVLLDGLVDGAEDDPCLGKLLLKGGPDALAVKDSVDSHIGKALLFGQGDAKLLEGAQKFWVHLIQALLLCRNFGPGVVRDALEVDSIHLQVCPVRHGHPLPLAECVQSEVQHPIWLALDFPDTAHGLLCQTLWDAL